MVAPTPLAIDGPRSCRRDGRDGGPGSTSRGHRGAEPPAPCATEASALRSCPRREDAISALLITVALHSDVRRTCPTVVMQPWRTDEENCGLRTAGTHPPRTRAVCPNARLHARG